MGVTDQFGLFDIAAHVIPGIVVLSAIGWVVADAHGGLPELPEEFVLATVGTVLAYVVGQICQLAADTPPGKLVLKGPRWRSESREAEWLRETPEWDTPGVRDAVRATLGERLGLKVPEPKALGPNEKAPKKETDAREACFRACYADLGQHGDPARPQMFKAIASFHESMAPASLAVTAAGLVVLARHGWHAPPAAIVGAAVLGFLLFRKAYRDFDRRFVESVYLGSYALARASPP